jgi:type III protein arginine methyltransferase
MSDLAETTSVLSDAALDRLIVASGQNALALARLSHEVLSRGGRDRSILLARKALELAPGNGTVRELARRTLSSGVPAWHFALVRDEARNRAYDAALRRVCRPDTRVLDIGSGTGLLAMMAARAGARDVVTCEVNAPVADAAAEIVALNGFAQQIRVVAKKSTDLDVDADLHGRVDVIVSELVSNNLLGEAALPVMADAVARLLEPGGRVIPSHGQVCVALAHHANLQIGRMTFVDGFDVRPFNRLATQCRPLKVGDPLVSLRSEPARLFSFDFQSGGPYGSGKASVALAATGGPVNGILQWIRLQLDEAGDYENKPAPGATSTWSPLFYQFDEDIDPAPGTAIVVNGVHDLTSVRIWATC